MTLPETRGRALRHPNSPHGSYPAPLAVLLVRSGGLAGQRLTVRQPIATIGSSKHADLQVVEPGISPLHARLELRQGIWSLVLLGRGNQAQVDGEPVVGEAPLSPGSTILLGQVAFLFEPRDGSERERSRKSERESIPAASRSSPARPGRSIGFFLTILLGLLLIAGGIVLELAR